MGEDKGIAQGDTHTEGIRFTRLKNGDRRVHITVLANPSTAHQFAHQAALMRGLAAHGVSTSKGMAHDNVPGDFVACWGWRIGKTYRARGKQVLVMERGYLGDRFAWTSLGWNGLNGNATFPDAPDDGGARFRTHFQLKPWRTGGDRIYVMGQVPGDASLNGVDMQPWYEKVIASPQLAKFNLPIIFRPHPLSRRPSVTEPETLEHALSRAFLVITHNSNTAVDAVVAGVPAVTVDQGSMAWEVTGHKLEEVLRPDRSKWAAALAWKQWTLDEITSGVALNGTLDVFRRS